MPLRLQKRFLESDGGKAKQCIGASRLPEREVACRLGSSIIKNASPKKAKQCELIMSLLEANAKSKVMSEFDAARLKAERKQKPPEMAKLWKIPHKQPEFNLIDIKNARKSSLLGTSDVSN